MAVAWICLNILDLWLTSQALQMGAIEANPVLNFFLQYDFWAFAVAKMLIAVGVLGIYQALREHKKVLYVFSGGNLLIGSVVIYEVLNIY